MSLLSETKSNVCQASTLVSTNTMDLPLTTTMSFPMTSGQYKQKVGVCTPGPLEFAPVIDIVTGEPIELPQGYIPMFVFLNAVEPLNDNYIGPNFSTSLTSIGDSYSPTYWAGTDINYKVVYDFNSTFVFSNLVNRKYLLIQNFSYPTVTTGTVKVYFLYTTTN